MLNIYRAYKSFNGSKVVTLEILPKNKQGRITGIVYAPKSWHSGVLEFIQINCYNVWSYSDVNVIIYIIKYDMKHWNVNKIKLMCLCFMSSWMLCVSVTNYKKFIFVTSEDKQ